MSSDSERIPSPRQDAITAVPSTPPFGDADNASPLAPAAAADGDDARDKTEYIAAMAATLSSQGVQAWPSLVLSVKEVQDMLSLERVRPIVVAEHARVNAANEERAQARHQELLDLLRGLTDRVQGLETAVQSSTAFSENIIRRRENLRVPSGGLIMPIVKKVPGFGPGLPPGPNNQAMAQLDLPEEPLPVCAAAPDFPQTRSAVYSMTHEQMHRLAAIYNETFGIRAGDSVDVRRDLVWEWCIKAI